jgi:pentatricopeptide repeat protein
VIEVLNEGPPGHEGRWSPYAALGDRQNNVVYNLGIKACAQAKQWKAATQLLADMRKRGRRPDLFSFNTALEACSAVRSTHKQHLLKTHNDGTQAHTNNNSF